MGSTVVNFPGFVAVVGDLLDSDQVRSMSRLAHHGKVTCYDHSLFVAYLSYRAARALGWDYRSAARGGLLHDLYLYNSKDKSAHPGLQCFDHPVAAARNAAALTDLSPKEEDIILSHMWPLAKRRPHSREAALVDFIDTFCATLELCRIYRPIRLRANLPQNLVPQAAAAA
jgi:uncharacterized protein